MTTKKISKNVSKKKVSGSKAQAKVHKVMKEFKEGDLHSGRKDGPKVKSRKQAIAIALSEAGASNEAKGKRK